MYRFGTWAKGGANSLKIAKLVPTSLKEPAGACKKAPIYLLLLNYKKIRTKARRGLSELRTADSLARRFGPDFFIV
jgi:hypothetical protein